MVKNKHIAKLEAQLEHIIEGAFANLFGKKINAQDIALRLSRAMEENLQIDSKNPQPVAPDRYAIHTHQDIHQQLLKKTPQLPQILTDHIVELANQAGYRLNSLPLVTIIADKHIANDEVKVVASHSDISTHSTAAMQKIAKPPIFQPNNAKLMIGDNRIINLTDDIINIGREKDNQIILDDPYASRHHAQLRLRFGTYLLFDIQSQSGTYVNDISIKEYNLQSGDVIRIGKTQMIYYEDNPLYDTDTTQPVDVLDTDSDL